MKLSDKPCYPIFNQHGYCSHLENNDALTGAKGLTFRERLIIALASNPRITFESIGDNGEGNLFPSKTADRIIQQADAIIKELEK